MCNWLKLINECDRLPRNGAQAKDFRIRAENQPSMGTTGIFIE